MKECLLVAQRIGSHPLGQELERISLVFVEIVVFQAHLFQEWLELHLFPHHASINSPAYKRAFHKELWKRDTVSLVRECGTILVAHIVLGVLEAVNINFRVRYTQAIEKARKFPAELTVLELPHDDLIDVPVRD